LIHLEYFFDALFDVFTAMTDPRADSKAEAVKEELKERKAFEHEVLTSAFLEIHDVAPRFRWL